MSARAPQASARAQNTTRRPPSLLLSSRRPSSSVVAVRASARAGEVEVEVEVRPGETEVRPGVYEGYWTWNPKSLPGEAHRIRYQRAAGGRGAGADGSAATAAPPVVLIHGFGANADQVNRVE